MNTFTINGKEYKAQPFDFNMVCELEDMGIALEEIGSKRLSSIRAYFKMCSGLSIKKAGIEIEQQYIKYGELDEISEVMNKEMDASDFFRALIERAKAETATDETEESKAEEEE